MDFHSRQALVGDIGGTYISLGIADIDELTISHFALLSTADFSRPLQAIERYLESVPRCPDKVSLAFAGTVTGDTALMPRRGWTITRNDIRAATGASTVTMLSDIDALALALPHLSDYDLLGVSPGEPVKYGTKVVIASGAGLSVAGLVWTGERWMPVSGAGGQASFAAFRPGEFDMRKALGDGVFVTAEQVLSGSGLVALYRGLAASSGVSPEPLTAPQITKAGLSGEDRIAVEAVTLMAVWLARFAGDVALLTGASGGVYLAGALSAGIVPGVDPGQFRAAFEDRGPGVSLAGKFPVSVVKMGADAGLRGAAVALARELPPSRVTGRRSIPAAAKQ